MSLYFISPYISLLLSAAILAVAVASCRIFVSSFVVFFLAVFQYVFILLYCASTNADTILMCTFLFFDILFTRKTYTGC